MKTTNQSTTAPTFVQFPFFLQTSFRPPPLPPPPASLVHFSRISLPLFLTKSISSSLEAAGTRECGVGTALPSLQPGPHVPAADPIPVSWAEGELETPCLGFRRKRTTVTVPRRVISGRTEKSAPWRSQRGRGLGQAPGDADPPSGRRSPGMTQRFLRTPALPERPRSISGRAPAGRLATSVNPPPEGRGVAGRRVPLGSRPSPIPTADPAWGGGLGAGPRGTDAAQRLRGQLGKNVCRSPPGE